MANLNEPEKHYDWLDLFRKAVAFVITAGLIIVCLGVFCLLKGCE